MMIKEARHCRGLPVECPHCGALRGHGCQTPKGRILPHVHAARAVAFGQTDTPSGESSNTITVDVYPGLSPKETERFLDPPREEDK